MLKSRLFEQASNYLEIRQCPNIDSHFVRSIYVVGLDIPNILLGLGGRVHMVGN